MGMFRAGEETFLLCYDGQPLSLRLPIIQWHSIYPPPPYSTEFGFLVNKHGDPIEPATLIEWVGKPERVVFFKPFVLLFDRGFVEVRHAETGRLVQIHTVAAAAAAAARALGGQGGLRCVWNGVQLKGYGETAHAEEGGVEGSAAGVHAVLSDHWKGEDRTVPVQRLVELVPV
jgi:hypothetical protein